MASNTKSNPLIAEALFWLHTVILLIVLVSGLFLSFGWVALILVVIRLQQRVFHGCLITVFEIKEGGLHRGQVYFQLAAQRFFGLKVGRHGVHMISTGFTILTLAISLVATLKGYRIKL